MDNGLIYFIPLWRYLMKVKEHFIDLVNDSKVVRCL